MKYSYVYIFIICIVLITMVQYNMINNDYISKRSTVDNKNYYVLKKDNSQIACNQLSTVNSKIKKLFEACERDGDPKYNRMIKKYSFDSLSELSPTSKYSAYSLNKGEKIKLCLRDNSNNLINNLNTSMFIMCHELSHLMTKAEQHPPIFWENMVLILKKANEAGVYTPIDYAKNPSQYGSSIVNKNPMFMEKDENPYNN